MGGGVRPFPFIVGCGRSATALLRAMVDAHPDVAVPPEAHVIAALAPPQGQGFDVGGFAVLLTADERFRLWCVDRAALAALYADDPPVDYPAAVRGLFAARGAREGKPRYADKTPGYVLHIPRLAQLFPEAVFVQL